MYQKKAIVPIEIVIEKNRCPYFDASFVRNAIVLHSLQHTMIARTIKDGSLAQVLQPIVMLGNARSVSRRVSLEHIYHF